MYEIEFTFHPSVQEELMKGIKMQEMVQEMEKEGVEEKIHAQITHWFTKSKLSFWWLLQKKGVEGVKMQKPS